MVDLKNVDGFAIVLTLIVPGLVTSFVRAQFITGRIPSHTDALLSYLAVSVLYYAVIFPAVGYVLSFDKVGNQSTVAWFALIFVGPAVFGLILGLNAQKEWLRRFLRWIRLNPVHVVPNAWDWKFGRMAEQWILVVLKDGTKFAGFCGENSFVSSDPKERDVYIERVYELDDQNKWHPRESSVLIAAGEIRTIEFWPYGMEKVNDDQ